MNVFYEDDGHFKVGSVFADNNTSLQVEAPHGKRTKIKAQNVLLRFDASLHEFMPLSEKIAGEIDLNFLWEVSGQNEFSFETLAKDYFGHLPNAHESAGLLICLHGAPMHFYKKGRGRYKPAPPDALKAAIASVEKKRLQAELQARYVAVLQTFQLPSEFAVHLNELLYKPDRNSIENKALEAACEALQMSPVRLLEKCGAIPSVHDYHLNRFLFEHFPRGTVFKPGYSCISNHDLPFADVQAFSIDDAATIEIDDAFSVTVLNDGTRRIGIHIAAPGIGCETGSVLDVIARDRMSTVYHPAGKITMMPEDVIAQFTLAEGQIVAVISLYLDVASDFRILNTESRVERIKIVDNLRLNALEAEFTEDNISANTGNYPYQAELNFLWYFASVLEAGRGKADSGAARVDYAFSVENDNVKIEPRRRGNPCDKVVSELMILVNSTWGEYLAKHNIPALYRVQQGGKVKMSTHPGPHEGLGVAQYAWSSSPIRRYVDLVNQRQLVAHILGQALPYNAAADLFEVMRSFELAYDAYAEFQRGMERYWCLRYLQQKEMGYTTGTIIRENLVRFDELPMVVRINNLPSLPAGSNVGIEIHAIDLIEREVSCHFKPIENIAESEISDSVSP